MSITLFKNLFFILLTSLLFSSCLQNNHKKSEKDSNLKIRKNKTTVDTENSTQDYLEKGKAIAMATGDLLSKKLFTAINANGPENALEFCNIQALPITDSMATELHAKIKRVSDKYRNLHNAANNMELEYIKHAKLEIEKNGSAKPKLITSNEKMIAYYPIITNSLCLQCHGNIETDISKETKTAIQINYPEDKATGYDVNELRGIWVIEMGQQNQ